MSQWSPIIDLPPNLAGEKTMELIGLCSVWKDQVDELKGKEEIARFNNELRREWAIETGIIEGLYRIDRGITVLLIEKGFEADLIPYGSTDRPAEEVVAILKDQHQALEWVFDFVAQRRFLSTSFIKELHSLLTRNQLTTTAKDPFGNVREVPLLRGDYKLHPNNPQRPDGTVHFYCPPEHVAAEMDRLITWHGSHQENDVSPEVESAWLHHRFTQIHPFQDGNGRVARALASLVLLQAKCFPLVIDRDDRRDYISSLEDADAGDLHLLIGLFVKIQKRAFTRALSISEDILNSARPQERVVQVALERLAARKTPPLANRQAIYSLADGLKEELVRSLRKRTEDLHEGLRAINFSYYARISESSEDNDFFFRSQIIAIARKLHYFADTRSYRGWVRVLIKEERLTRIVFALHGLGYRTAGTMAVSSFVMAEDPTEATEEDVPIIEEPIPVCEEAFQFSYNEKIEDLRPRFKKWLDKSYLVALDSWRRKIG